MTDAAALLRRYDEQLRTSAELRGALSMEQLGPIQLATYDGGRGFVTYRALTDDDGDASGAPLSAEAIAGLVAAAAAHYTPDPRITRVEWKTRGHDHAPGLHDALIAHGFEPEERESIMLGEAAALAVDVPLPDGVTLRRIEDEADVQRMEDMLAVAFGAPMPGGIGPLVRRMERERDTLPEAERMAILVAEHDGDVVCGGRLEPVPGTEFAGIWGGATREDMRGRGIYRALTAERARLALAAGKRYINSDSTDYSRPILERSGFVAASTTTPYVWRRADAR